MRLTGSPTIQDLAMLPLTTTLLRRRQAIQNSLPKSDVGALICAGLPAPRNFPANHYQGFRANSHFLYLVGQHIAGAVLLLTRSEAILFVYPPTKSGALWHGEEKNFDELSQEVGCSVRSLDELEHEIVALKECLRPPSFQAELALYLQKLTKRDFDEHIDRPLLDAFVQTRLVHDEEGIKQLHYAAELTRLVHEAGFQASHHAQWAHQVRAAMEAPLIERGASLAYAPIITPHGEVLHNHHYHAQLNPGDLLLADVGAETPQGWAGDVTRTWPVSGQWSPSQKAIYEIVLEALNASTALASPGVEYAVLHQKTREVMTLGLIDLGILKGSVDENLDANSVALFFPHGVGHLLGMDVHDMEDLGDLAGYASGRQRRSTFGWGYLRLDRPLQAGMAITVEPGFYQVAALLKAPEWAGPKAGQKVNWSRLEQFKDVRGIRIEDDLLITSTGYKNLSAHIPKTLDELSKHSET